MRQFYFEKLDVWQEARSFVKNIYEVSSTFPTEERYGMISQIRRASMSIAANIAEGMSRKTDKDKARFINLAFSSAIEVLNHLIISRDFEWLTEEEYMDSRTKLEKITNQLNSLHRTLNK